MNETLCRTIPVPEATESATKGKQNDQTIMHIDVCAYYLSAPSLQTTSRAVRALLTGGSSKFVRVDIRYTEACGPHEVMLNIDRINIYTKTMITCDEVLAGQIYVGREELRVRSIGHCAMLEKDAMHIGTEADISGHVLDTIGKKTQLRGLLDTGAILSVIPIETWKKMGFDKGDLINSRIRLSAANKGALRVLGRTPIIALNLGERNLWMSFFMVENLDESDQFILGRDFQIVKVPIPNSQSAAFLGRSFSITKSDLPVNVLLNTLDIPITI